MLDNLEGSIDRYKIEEAEKWREWIEKIPSINFDSTWKIQVIPPFSGALVRFRVICGDANISVYLDVYDRLGCHGSPYWEIYPINGDTARCNMENVDELVSLIRQAIEEFNSDSNQG